MLDIVIRNRQLALLYRNAELGQTISVANAVLLVWLWHETVGLSACLAWLSAVAVLAGLRIAAALRFRRIASPSPAEGERWFRLALTGAGLSGALWSAGAFLFIQGADTVQALFGAFTLSGMVAGAVPILSAHRLAFRLYGWPILLSVMLSVARNDPIHIAFEILTLLFLLACTRGADMFHRTLYEGFRLELEKESLINDLQQARLKAESSDRAKTQFLANISHELRTPMNGIIGLTELLHEENPTPAQRELIEPLHRSAQHLMHLIGNLIELSALEAGKVELLPDTFAIGELMTSLVYRHRAQAEAKGLQLRESLAANLPSAVVGDAERLRQVFHHLIENAIKFTERGSIELAVDVIEQSATQARLRFAVRDTGIGIAPDVLPQLQGLFVQADGSSVRRHQGIGVGLPIARRLVELMGGRLEVASAAGQGSTFSFAIALPIPAVHSG